MFSRHTRVSDMWNNAYDIHQVFSNVLCDVFEAFGLSSTISIGCLTQEQLRQVHSDHHRAQDLLQAQIDSLDRENLRLQRDLQAVSAKSATSPRPAEKDKSVTPTPQEFVQDFRHIERQEGEVIKFSLIIIYCTASENTRA